MLVNLVVLLAPFSEVETFVPLVLSVVNQGVCRGDREITGNKRDKVLVVIHARSLCNFEQDFGQQHSEALLAVRKED